MTPRPPSCLRVALGIVALGAWLVPGWHRQAWRRQWEADLTAYAHYLGRDRPRFGSASDLVFRSLGVFRHALWLRARQWSFDMWIHDLRSAFRLAVRRPAFTAVAVLILGIGIGANATIFSWAEALVLRPLPGVPDSDHLVVVHGTMRNRADLSMSYPNYADLRDQLPPGVEGLVCQRLEAMTLRSGASGERVWGSMVSGNYFSVLGVTAVLGRTFRPDEDATPGTHPVAVLSHRFWQRRFQSRADIVGQTVMLNEHPFTVIGVAAPGFQGTNVGVVSDLFVPIMMQGAVVAGDRLHQRGNGWLKVLARLEPGATIDRARAGFALAARRLTDYPENAGRGLAIYPLWRAPSEASGFMAPVLGVLMVVVGVVLLIACANLASLLLARAPSRQREISMRLALGAGRWRVVRQLLTENLLLAALGGAAGLAMASWTAGLLTAFLPPSRIPLLVNTGLSWRVFGFAALVTVATGMVFGLAPALQASGISLMPGLRGDSLHSTGRSIARKTLVVAQIALSMVLLVTAALFLRTLGNARTMETGFSLRQGLLASIDLLPAGYDAVRGQAFYRELVERTSALPGVRAATVAERMPLSLSSSDMLVDIEGYTPARNEDVDIYYNRVAARYFETMGIPIVAGRAIDERDTRDRPGVVVIDEEMARRYWKNGRAIGGRVRVGDKWLEVVGIARSGKYERLTESPRPFMYMSIYQSFRTNGILIVASGRGPLDLAPAIASEVRSIDARLPVFDVMTVEEHLQLSVFIQRMAATLLGIFGAVALLLATMGLYGVLAYLAAERTREIGIRMALGASRRDIVRLVVGQGLGVTAVGVLLGTAAAAAGARLLASQLIGVGPLDPASFVATLTLLVSTALLACYLPARRAAWQDPLRALRHD